MECDIIIPTYENEDLTAACIESIKKNTKDFRILWVDNGSKGRQKVHASLQGVNHIAILLPTNQGFVGAVNLGIAVSNAPFVCLLNNDTLVSPRWLDKLTTALIKNPKLGIVGAITAPPSVPRKYDSHHCTSHIEDFAGKRIFPEFTNLNAFNLAIEKKFSGVLADCAFVAFLCAVIKRKVIFNIGFLDPNYAMGMYDDNDYNLATRKAGWETKLLYDTCIKHYGRSTFKMIRPDIVDGLLKKNKAYMDKKWASA